MMHIDLVRKAGKYVEHASPWRTSLIKGGCLLVRAIAHILLGRETCASVKALATFASLVGHGHEDVNAATSRGLLSIAFVLIA